ncbi:hypothetical protein ACXR2T_08680 [Leucobacter sp. HY1910]
MEEVPYGRILREGWLIILIAVLLGGGIGYGMTKPMPRSYAATSTLLLQVDSAQTSLFERNQFSQARIKSYPALVDSPQVVNGVRTDLHLSPAVYSDREIRSMLSATNTSDTVLMDVRALAPTSKMAAAMANSAAKHLSVLIEATENDKADGNYQVKLEQALPAVPPQSAVSPQVIPIVGLGLLVGLTVGALIALYRTTSNRRLLNISDVRRVADLPVVGQIPRLPRFRSAKARAKGLNSPTYTEAVSNLMALAGSTTRTLVLVPAEAGALGEDTLIGLRDAYRQVGRTAHILDTRQSRFPPDQFHPLEDLIQSTIPKSKSDASVDSDPGSAALGLDPLDLTGGAPHDIYTTTVIDTAKLESMLPGLIRHFNDPLDVALVVIDPEATTLLAAVRAPLVIDVRSHAASFADLMALTIRLQVMDIQPLGVLLTSARSRLRTAVSLTWNDLDTHPARRVPSPHSNT